MHGQKKNKSKKEKSVGDVLEKKREKFIKNKVNYSWQNKITVRNFNDFIEEDEN